MKIKTGSQYVGYFYYREHLNWAAQNLRVGRGLDIAALDLQHKLKPLLHSSQQQLTMRSFGIYNSSCGSVVLFVKFP